MNNKRPPITESVEGNRPAGNEKPSRIAYWERRNRQKKHENRRFPAETEHRDHAEASEERQPVIERRQFVDSYSELSPQARELALAIDAYKIHFHRRFINHEELLTVIQSLGYTQEYGP